MSQLKDNRICVVMPAMNEGLTIASVVASVLELGYQVVVIDDASVDDTATEAKRAGALVLSHIKTLGAWKATQTGLRYAKKHSFDVVITMDSDGQHQARDIPLLLEQFECGAQVVIGNCTSRGSTGRHIAWRFFKRLNRLNVKDVTSGFRLYSKEAISGLVSVEATMLEYQCIGVLIMMRNMQMRVVETSVTMNERTAGISRIFNSWFIVCYYLLSSFLLSATKGFPTKKEEYVKRISRERNFG